jgi:hypothetical protein
MMVTMAALQVFIVRFFFQGARKGRLYICFLHSIKPQHAYFDYRICLVVPMLKCIRRRASQGSCE